MVTDRDLNAAINLNTVGKAHPEPTPVCVQRTGRNACGHDGSVSAAEMTETTSMDKAGSKRGVMITIALS